MDKIIKIFVSYTTKDSYIEANYLQSVYEKVSTVGNVYIDLLHNDSIDKQNRVYKELITSDVLILIESDSVNKSYWVEWEIALAQKISIPIIKLKPNFTSSELQIQLSSSQQKLTSCFTGDPNSTSLLCYSRYRSILAQQAG